MRRSATESTPSPAHGRQQSSESAPDKRTICGADKAKLEKRERDVLEGLRKLKTDIAAAASKTETLSSSIHEELIDKSLKDHSSNRESVCPTKEKYVSRVRSESSRGLFDDTDEPARSIFTYKLVYAKKRTSIGDAHNILSHLLRTLDDALARQEARIARIVVAFQACRRRTIDCAKTKGKPMLNTTKWSLRSRARFVVSVARDACSENNRVGRLIFSFGHGIG